MLIFYPVKQNSSNFTNYLNPLLTIFPNVNFHNIYSNQGNSPGKVTFWKIQQDPANSVQSGHFFETVKSSPVSVRFRSGSGPVPVWYFRSGSGQIYPRYKYNIYIHGYSLLLVLAIHGLRTEYRHYEITGASRCLSTNPRINTRIRIRVYICARVDLPEIS